MTALDRAFIKVYDEPAPPQATAAWPAASAPPTSPAKAPPPPVAQDDLADDDVLIAECVEADPRATLPLSSFSAGPKVQDSFRALLEIDRAHWPTACDNLLAEAIRDWDRFTEQLIERISQGQKCVALASVARGEGRTTISLALAKHVAARGQRPVVVDADPQNPQLARSCGVAVRTGWDDLLDGELDLGEALITAIEDHVTLMPWRGGPRSASELAAAPRTASIFATLREHYDVVLVDAMPLVGQTTIAEFARFADAIHLDALYLIHNVRGASREQLAATSAKLRRGGLPLAGVIENFVSAARGDDRAGTGAAAAARHQAALH